jgi:2-dehydro-3-deoxygalactonokinase
MTGSESREQAANRGPAAFIGVDWGTSHARFALCDERGSAFETVKGPGAVESRGRFAEVFDRYTGVWRERHGALPAYLCGMAGSAIGWREAPYLPAPADLHELADALVAIRDGISVVPGLRCTNPLGAPDMMRGEETQLLGARELAGILNVGHTLVCMPGTHTKWVSVFDGTVQEFISAPTGELFAVLGEHSVLVRDPTTPLSHHEQDFCRGLGEAEKHPGRLLHQLFQARSLRLDGQLSAHGAASWMSGLLIGTDVIGALELFDEYPEATVCLVGTPELTRLYGVALGRRGRRTLEVDGAAAAVAGLAFLHRARNGGRE